MLVAKLNLAGWNISGILRYGSGEPIPVPNGQNNLATLLFRGTYANRVEGQPLFTKDLNCGCIDPRKDFVLNPAAWADPAPGTFGQAAPFYSDYRFARVYDENLSFGKITKFSERTSLEFRAEFFNALNHASFADPNMAANTAQFGVIRATRINGREIQLVLKFIF